MLTYSVYIHITPNNKKYIGITKNAPQWRWRGGSGYSKSYFGKAVKKYGWENIRHGVYAEGLSKNEAEKMEIALISFYDTTNPKFGYNITEGGHIGLQESNPEFKEKLRLATTGKNNHKSIPVRCIETGEIFDSIGLAAAHYGVTKTGILRVLKGRNKKTGGYSFEATRMEDKKKKIHTKSRKQIAAALMKPVAVYNAKGELIDICNSRNDAAYKYGTSSAKVSNCISGKNKTSNGYYFADAANDVPIRVPTKMKRIEENNPAAKSVLCYDLNGRLVKQYNYATKASKELNIDLSSIIKCCKRKIKTCGGYIWRYMNPDVLPSAWIKQ